MIGSIATVHRLAVIGVGDAPVVIVQRYAGLGDAGTLAIQDHKRQPKPAPSTVGEEVLAWIPSEVSAADDGDSNSRLHAGFLSAVADLVRRATTCGF